MNKNIFKLLIGLILCSSLNATNGDHLISTSGKALGMGGVGIAVSHGAESALVNPSLISSIDNNEVVFGGTIFMVDVETDNGVGYTKSSSDLSVIPSISLASKIDDNLYIGVGMWGTAGMGVDYRGDVSNYEMVTSLQLMQFGVPIAYKSSNFGLGITPIIQYGALDISYTGSTTKGVSQDISFGYNIGGYYNMDNFTLGITYKSPISMRYNKQVSLAAEGFGLTGFSDILEQPEEIGVGISYSNHGSTFGIDVKDIKWSKAEGYNKFGWQDQRVIALGYEFKNNNYALRAGYNYANSPIINNDDQRINMLNLMGFPATITSHYTFGWSYTINKKVSFDFAEIMTTDETTTYGNTSNKHSQNSTTLQVNYKF